MKIQDRFKKIFPAANVYWNSNINQLSLHFCGERVNESEVKLKVYKELSFCGLLNAVDSVRIFAY